MNFAKFLSALELAVPTIGQIVTTLHPENVAEGVKIAAGVELFKVVSAGIHAISESAATTEAPAAPVAPSPNV
jgi:hypothetical protein